MGTVPGTCKEQTNHWLRVTRLTAGVALGGALAISIALTALVAQHTLPVGTAVYIEMQAWLIVVAALSGTAAIVSWLLTVSRTGDIGEAIAETAAQLARDVAGRTHWEELLDSRGVNRAETIREGSPARRSGG